MILKSIVILIGLILFLKFLNKYVNPVVKAANKVNEKEKKEKNTVTYVQHKNPNSPKSADNDGEYIEYKELD